MKIDGSVGETFFCDLNHHFGEMIGTDFVKAHRSHGLHPAFDVAYFFFDGGFAFTGSFQEWQVG